jgi:hypothetical protein
MDALAGCSAAAPIPTSPFARSHRREGLKGSRLAGLQFLTHIDSDPQFGATPASFADFIKHDEPHPAAGDVTGTWCSLDYTYLIEEGPTVLPKPPIK